MIFLDFEGSGGRASERSWLNPIRWGVLFVLLHLSVVAQAADPDRTVLIEPSFEMRLLDPYLDYLEDVEGEWTIEALLDPVQQGLFQRNEEGLFSDGYSQSVYWFRFRLLNVGENSRRLLLLWESESLQAHAWAVEPGRSPRLIWEKGRLPPSDGLPRAQRLGTSWDLAPGVETEIYLSLQVNMMMKAQLTLWSPETYASHERRESAIYSAAWGAALLFSLLALLVFASLRERVYLYYFLFLSCFLWLRILRVDLHGEWTEWTGMWGYWLGAFCIWGSGLFGILFSVELLRLDTKKEPFWRPLIIGLSASFPATLLMGSERLAMLIVTASIVVVAPLPWYWGLREMQQKNPIAQYYLLGFGALVLPTGLAALVALGIVPYTFSLHAALEFFALLNALVFAIAMSMRFQALQQQALQDQQRALQKMEESDRLKEQFLMSTTHELKTPLQGIIGLSQEMLGQLRQDDRASFEQSLEVVLHSAQRLNYLISNLLDLSSLQHAELPLNRKPVDPALAVETITTLMRPRFKAQNTKLQQECGALPKVYADSTKLEQVLMNLLGNALKYAPGAPVLVVVKEVPGWVCFEVHDGGKGVPEELRKEVFRRFERGGVRNIEGLGLGLALCKEIVERHDGEIGVEDSELGGAKFWFTIPALPTERVTSHLDFGKMRDLLSPGIPLLPATSDDSSRKRSEGSKEELLLIVDDDPDVIQVLLVMLQQTSWQISYCSSGAEALELLSEGTPVDLVVLDVMMPGMDGFEVCEVIRKQYSQAELPVVFLTALARSEDIAQAFQVGGNDYLTKPVVKLEFIQRISAQLELKALRGRGVESSLGRLDSDRELLSTTMQEALACWQHCVRKDQIALALESKVWGAYLDKSNGVWKAPGIRHYLSSASMPKNPRWRKVVQTAEFVLHQTAEDDPHREKLANLVQDVYRQYTVK